MNVSLDFFDRFIQIVLEIFYLASAVLFYYWLSPFIIRKRALYAASFLYWAISLIPRFGDFPVWCNRLFGILAFIVPVTILYFLDKRCNPLQKIFLCAIFSLIWWIVMEVMSELGFYQRDISYSPVSVTALVIGFIAYNILYYGFGAAIMFFSFRLLHRTYKRKQEELTWREFVMLLAPTGSMLAVKPIVRDYFLLWMQGIENGSIEQNIPGNPFRILFCILSYVSMLVILIFYQQIKDNQEEEYARRALESQTEDMHRHMEQIEETYERMRAMRHDMGNHMAVIQGLIESGDRDAASDYIGEWRENFGEMGMSVKTGNPFTDAAISGFADRFDAAGIPFEQSFVYPDELRIEPFDLCVVLSNALQNAYEASVSVNDPHVSLTSVLRNNTFIINVKNRIGSRVNIDKEAGIPYSSKKEDGHGYGLKNIRNIAHKYNGDIDIRQENDGRYMTFVLNVMLIG